MNREVYDANALRAAIYEQNGWANIPPKANRKDPICFSPYLYKARNLIERFFNKIKHYRRIATRYDKLAENFLADLQLFAVRSGYAVMSPKTNAPLCVGPMSGASVGDE